MNNKTQKILIVCPQIGKILEGKPAGGAEKQTYLLFNKFKNVKFLVSSKKEIQGNYICIKNPLFALDKINFAIKNSDVIVFLALSKFSYFYFWLAKFYNKKIIYFVRSNADVGLYLKESSNYYSWVPKLAFPVVDIFICQTSLQLKNLKKYNQPKYIIPNPIIMNKEVTYKNNNFILWVGRNHKVKGIDILEKIIRDLSNINFKIIGINKSEIDLKHKNAEILGRIDTRAINKYFNEASIYINTSYTEGYPNAVLESFNNKTPVITYNTDPDSLLKKSKGGMCAYRDIGKFINIINKLYSDKKTIKKMGCAGYNYIKKNNGHKMIIKKIEKIFEKHGIKLEK